MGTDEDGLIAPYIEPNPHHAGPADVRLRDYAVLVWALILYWNAAGRDIARVAKDQRVARAAVQAAVACYRRNQAVIDARIAANAAQAVEAFYLDDGVSLEVATALRHRGHVATTAQDEGFKGAPVERHLLGAASHGWALVTHHGQDVCMLHRAWLLWSQSWQVHPSHPGTLVLAQVPRGLAAPAAQEIDRLVRMGPPFANRLYDDHASGCTVPR